MSRVFGANPRPRVLLEDIPTELQQDYRNRFPTVRAVKDLAEVDQSEFDMLVTTWRGTEAEAHLRVIVFSRPTPANDIIDRCEQGQFRLNVTWGGESKAREFHVPPEWPLDVRAFIQDRLIPIVANKAANSTLEPKAILSPFLRTARGEVLAGQFRRVSGVDCWAFPLELVVHGADCAAIAVGLWRNQDLKRFPEPSQDWTKQPRWQTLEEQSCASELRDLREKRQQVLDTLQAEESALEAKQGELATAANSQERLLLTAQGDELVRAVQRCLEELGFEVQFMDDVWKAGDRLEDLRVHLSADPKWTAIVEVRGYKNGAAVNDLVRLLARFRSRYFQEIGTLPSSSWYVANAFIPEDPANRPPILHSNDAEVETFSEDDGLAIGTVMLFDLLMDVRIGRLTQQEAQQLLRESRGRIAYQRSDV